MSKFDKNFHQRSLKVEERRSEEARKEKEKAEQAKKLEPKRNTRKCSREEEEDILENEEKPVSINDDVKTDQDGIDRARTDLQTPIEEPFEDQDNKTNKV